MSANGRKISNRRWLLVLGCLALANLVLGVFATLYAVDPAQARKQSAPESLSSTVQHLATPIRLIHEGGTLGPPCDEIVRPYDSNNLGETRLLATGATSGGATWLFCEGEAGSGVGAISARSTGQGIWITQQLPVSPRLHAGDEVQIAFGSDGRVSLTSDSFVAESHTHIWTSDGGSSWLGIRVP